MDIEVPDGETAYIEEQGTNYDPYVYGAITGSGTLHLKNNTSSTYRGPKIYGDLSKFAGTIIIDKNNRSDYQRNETTIYDGDRDGVAGSALANWKDCYSSSASSKNLLDKDVKYYFGAYTGEIYQSKKAGLIEIGALNAPDDSLGGAIYYTPLRKVGTGTLTVSAKNVGETEINGGTVEIAADTQNGTIMFTGDGEYRQNATVTTDYSKKFKGSTAFPVVFNDGDIDRVWATAIDASNKAGFTKKGSGTLTLSAEPKYAGFTKVEAGALVVPEGTKVALDLASAGTLTGATITNAAFAVATTVTTVASDLDGVAVKAWDAAIDVGNLTIDLREKTEWAKGATYYVVTEGGVVCGDSVVNRRSVQLLLPEDQQKDWTLSVVELNGKKTLAVKKRGGLIMVIR